MKLNPATLISNRLRSVRSAQELVLPILAFLLALIAATLFANAGRTFAAGSESATAAPRFAPGRILVAPRPGSASADFLQALIAQGGRSLGRLHSMDVHVVEVPSGSEQDAVAELAANPHVRFAELDQLAPSAGTASDPSFPSQWHLARIEAPAAWDTSAGMGITIAILDSGVDGTHPDLAAQMVPGWNFVDNNGDTADVFGHGTAVAGAAAATASSNGVGIAGRAEGVRIMPVRIADAAGYAYWSTAAQGLAWAADQGAHVANISLAGMAASRTMQDAASYFRSKGGTVVVAAGNTGGADFTAPTETMIVVSATDHEDRITNWSTYGSFVTISAPGKDIHSTAMGGGYESWSGTSMAAPIVAGTAALILALRPDLTPAQVQSALLGSATDLGPLGPDIYYGHGRVNAAAAVQAAGLAPTGTATKVAKSKVLVRSSCLRANPTILISPSQGPGVQAGTMLEYKVTVTNNDTTACKATTFNLTRSMPAGWTATFLSSALKLSPGTSGGTILDVTSPASATNSSNPITATATNASASRFLRTASATYVVANVVPGAPAIVAATAGNAQASVSFTAPASNGGSAVTSYTAKSSPGGITASGASSPLTVTGLTNGTAYTFTVTATNAVGTGADSAASNAVTPAAPIVPSSDCAPTVGTTELLANTGFEGTYTNVATGWTYNRSGNPTMSFAKDATTFHGGGASQKITVSPAPDSSSFAYFLQNYTFKGGVTYEASVWLRSADGAVVTFLLRRAGPYYEAGASQRIQLTTTWTKYTIRGGWDTDVPGLFELNFNSAGTVNVDDASLHEISRETDCVATQDPIPASLFGQHINKWGSYPQWPTSLNFKRVRLWDTGTRWMDLETTKGTWKWTRFDYYVTTALKYNNDIIYTLGMTPAWASANGLNTAPAADINDWRNYVRTVATRYKGKIKYWELWNETDYSGFYTGTVDQMYQLAIAAQQELKAVDPTNIVLSPNITTNGIGWLDRFLALGGGQYVDIISWHRYTTYRPEADLPLLNAVKSVMAQRGISKPIWNTEGATKGAPPSPESARGAIARNYLMMWSWGVENFGWYGWDLDLGNPLSQPDWTTPTASGVAYRQTASWLTGSKMTSKHRDTNGTWTVVILDSTGKQAYIVWNETTSITFSIPVAWSVKTKRDLAGASSDVTGMGSVPIGPSPILLGG